MNVRFSLFFTPEVEISVEMPHPDPAMILRHSQVKMLRAIREMDKRTLGNIQNSSEACLHSWFKINYIRLGVSGLIGGLL